MPLPRKRSTYWRPLAGVAVAVAFASGLAACWTERVDFVDEPGAVPPETDGGEPSLGSAPDAPSGDVQACVRETFRPTAVPLSILLLLDRSESMLDGPDSTRWERMRAATLRFADSKVMANTNMALSLFPSNDDALECDPRQYRPVVPMGALPGVSVQIKAELYDPASAPNGSTPMATALVGATDYLKTYLEQHPSEIGAIVLVTDGTPTSDCRADDLSHAVDAAAKAALGTPSVRTFAVGMEGANFANLDAIASAGGGAPTAFDTTLGQDGGTTATDALFEALGDIRTAALGCEYEMPPSLRLSEETVDGDFVVEYAPGKNDPAKRFVPVASSASCGVAEGFYFEMAADAQAPRLILCPTACGTVRTGTSSAELTVVVGCANH